MFYHIHLEGPTDTLTVQAFDAEMQSFLQLYTRYLTEKLECREL